MGFFICCFIQFLLHIIDESLISFCNPRATNGSPLHPHHNVVWGFFFVCCFIQSLFWLGGRVPAMSGRCVVARIVFSILISTVMKNTKILGTTTKTTLVYCYKNQFCSKDDLLKRGGGKAHRM